ncbi:hypothetical protein [Taibaiella helva]|uniref:hypothetical protein n=1 Tax=Taibaiella helva TaxID=2301235 RepID=UPI000E582038|nr:hypothetical protein [Taibaiella helva]
MALHFDKSLFAGRILKIVEYYYHFEHNNIVRVQQENIAGFLDKVHSYGVINEGDKSYLLTKPAIIEGKDLLEIRIHLGSDEDGIFPEFL